MDDEKAKSISNKIKSNAGRKWDDVVEEKLTLLKDEGLIRGFDRNLNFLHAGFNYDKQYLANFVIYTNDGKRIIVRSSNSFRDRVKIGFYDIDGILRHSNLKDDIIAAIYLVPDQELQNTTFNSTREKFRNGDYYSPATHIFILSEFTNFISNYEFENRSILQEIIEDKKATNLKEAGSYYGKTGNKLEKDISESVILNGYLNKLKLSENPKFHQIFDFIVNKHHISFEDIINIKSSNSIPLLVSGGSAKADIWIELECVQKKILETFSIKNTTKRIVSVHDYTSDRFIEVLNCDNTQLANYLRLFQEYPTYSDFESNFKQGYSKQEFEDLMNPKSHMLSEWVLLGEHDSVNLNFPRFQISNNLIINTEDDFLVYDSREYLNYLYANVKLKFSTPFTWTYPSKQRGKRIQLKLPIRKIT